MKIKSILAISAFAASMSAFAQSTPVAAGGSAKQSPRSSADRSSIRNAVQEFQEQHGTPPVNSGTLPPMPTPRVALAADEEAVRTAAVRREHLRKSVQRHEQRQAWAEKRELVNEAKHSRVQKRQERVRHKAETPPVIVQ
jgi:hypothetical protein